MDQRSSSRASRTVALTLICNSCISCLIAVHKVTVDWPVQRTPGGQKVAGIWATLTKHEDKGAARTGLPLLARRLTGAADATGALRRDTNSFGSLNRI